MKDYHAVSLSGGKDSTALLLKLLEEGMPIDAVLCADTGMEFPEMYEHLDRLDRLLCRERGIHIDYLRHPKGFEWLMFEQPIERGEQWSKLPPCGYGWPNARNRWCTSRLKTQLIDKRVNELKAGRKAIHYVGIAADEPQRVKGQRYPLAEWGMTGAMNLQYCYDRGYGWGGLYEIYRRCSCWCCPLQPIDGLRKLRKHHPALWQRLRDMDERAREQFGASALARFKQGWPAELLEQRFDREDRQMCLF